MSYCSVKAAFLGASSLASVVRKTSVLGARSSDREFFKLQMSVHCCLTFFLCNNFRDRLWAIWVLPELTPAPCLAAEVVWPGSVLPTSGRLCLHTSNFRIKSLYSLAISPRVFVSLDSRDSVDQVLGELSFWLRKIQTCGFMSSVLVCRFLEFANATVLLDGCKKAQQNKKKPVVQQTKVLQYCALADRHGILALPPFSKSFLKQSLLRLLK